ncbi:Obg family GTPase CgtA, partial [Chloroflexota bacterium]
IAVNKIDLPEVKGKVDGLGKEFRDAGLRPYFISAAGGEGVAALMTAAGELLEQFAAEVEQKKITRKIFHPQPEEASVGVHKEGKVFVITAPEMARLKTRDGTVNSELRQQLKNHLARKGFNRALEKAGIQPGDRIRCGDLEWDW